MIIGKRILTEEKFMLTFGGHRLREGACTGSRRAAGEHKNVLVQWSCYELSFHGSFEMDPTVDVRLKASSGHL